MKPSVYSDWSKIFDDIETWEIGHVDEEVLLNMEQGTIEWTDGVSQRLTLRLIDMVNKRLQNLNLFYNKRLSMSYSTFDLSNLLVIFRKELIFIKRLDSLPIWPDEIKTELVKDLVNYANKAQKTLEDSAKHDLSGELKRIVLNYRLDNI